MFYGLLNLPWWGYIIVTLVLTHITIVSVTLFLHRCQAHRALTLHPVVSHFFRLWLWLTTGMETKAWAAIHRKHHAKCETEEDPHSPQIFSLPIVLWQGAELYRKEAKNAETLERYGKGTPDDWLERNLYHPYSAKGILIMLALNLLLFGVPGLTIWAIQMAWIPFFAAGVINGIGHFWGYRNCECPDASTNISPWGVIIGGEELHNNHHTYPTSAKFSVKWWEFDIGWMYIRALSVFGLAKAKRVPPKPVIVAGKNTIDGETLKALIHNRFQVMTKYSRTVLMPLFENAKTRNQDLKVFHKMKSYLIREESLIEPQTKSDLEKAIEQTDQLKVAYHLRKNLQEIWGRTAATQRELVEALQDWCTQAEATGIKYLQDFSEYMRGYTLIQRSH